MKTIQYLVVGIALALCVSCGKNDPVKSATSHVDRIEQNLDGLHGSDKLAIKRIEATRKEVGQLRKDLDRMKVSQDTPAPEAVNPDQPVDNRTLYQRVTFQDIPEPPVVERTLLQRIVPGGK